MVIRKHAEVIVKDHVILVIMETVIALITKEARILGGKFVSNSGNFGGVNITHPAFPSSNLCLEH